MDSTNSLIGLLSQLQSIETKFASVLMEAALKLMDLTDVKLFILLETEDQHRYFGGKDHLCEQFVSGCLVATDADIEMQANVEISSLTPKSNETSQADWNLGPSIQGEESSFDPSSVPTENFHCGGVILEDRQEEESGHCEQVDGGQAAAPNFSRRKRKLASQLDHSPAKLAKVELDEQVYQILDDDEVDDPGCDEISIEDRSPSYDCETAENHIFPWIKNEIDKDSKIRNKVNAVLQIDDFDVLKEKESIERKVVLSMFYSLGSSYLLLPPEERVDLRERDVRNDLFEKVWAYFPNLHPYACMKIPRSTENANNHAMNLITISRDSFTNPFRREKFNIERRQKKLSSVSD